MPTYIRKRFGERLVEEGLITAEQFELALKKHKETKVLLRQILVDLGFISEDKLLEFTAKVMGIPVVKDLLNKITDPQIVKIVPEKTCRQNFVLPLYKTANVLTIAMFDPFDVFVLDDLQALTKCKIESVLSKKEDILKTLSIFYEEKENIEEIVKGMTQEAEELEIIRETREEENEKIDAQAVDAPIIRLVNTIITQAIKQRASDIHVEPDEKGLRIRYRIDGILRETMSPPKRLQAPIISRIKIMAEMDISIKRQAQDGRFKIRVENKNIDVRISSVPTIYGEKLVMRLLDKSFIQMGLMDCGLSKSCLERFSELINRPYGIILVTGPTGSGKTTTLYLALQTLNSPDKNIITIEEPVEYDLEGVNQIPVNSKAGITFAKGLRSILRQDPDVIMVGEMRDLETADVAVRAALTGHLVFSTLHTNDACSSIIRLIDMGIASYLVTSSICCVLAQRLVRTICDKCKEAYTPSQEQLDSAGIKASVSEVTFYRGKGCEDCGQTGFRGRTGLFELMVVDKKLRQLIHEGQSVDALRSASQKSGMKFLWDDGLEKVLQGQTTIEELKRVTFLEGE